MMTITEDVYDTGKFDITLNFDTDNHTEFKNRIKEYYGDTPIPRPRLRQSHRLRPNRPRPIYDPPPRILGY